MLIPQVAYLASSLFLDHNSDLIILVVNTLTQDLKSDNYLTGKSFGQILSILQSMESRSAGNIIEFKVYLLEAYLILTQMT